MYHADICIATIFKKKILVITRVHKSKKNKKTEAHKNGTLSGNAAVSILSKIKGHQRESDP